MDSHAPSDPAHLPPDARTAADEAKIRARFEAVRSSLDERSRRRWAAAEAKAAGRGGTTRVSRATGICRSTIRRGLSEIREEAEGIAAPQASKRIRRRGAGRKPLVESDPEMVAALERLLDPATRGDPMSPLLWTSKSTRRLSRELARQGHRVSHSTVTRILHAKGYSLKGLRKSKEGGDHVDRDAQFRFISERVQSFLDSGDPVISVDTKKKELVGEFKNGGREWRPKGKPRDVNVYDFIHLGDGKASPYGIYDIGTNEGWVNVGMDHDTSVFAVQSIRRWWEHMGRHRHPGARRLLITADGGGSNGSRSRLWKVELQQLVDELGIPISVCHFPPGTSKWNKIEHRMFSFITENWRGEPLVTFQVIVDLIANTRTEAGLRIEASLDTNEYPIGMKVSDSEMRRLNLKKEDFHGEWNYAILPTA